MDVEKNNKNKKKIKADLPSGFRDADPRAMIAKNELLKKVIEAFENFGFDPMDTPAVERTEVLTGGEEESSKIIFNVRGSRDDKSDTSLRFDLTVPLARFLAANTEIPKPFKRYQVSKVWRGESPQAGRYREFTQADIDIVGSSSMEADAEIIALINDVFKRLEIKSFVIKINNRKILNSLPSYAGFSENSLLRVLQTIDKQDKIGYQTIKEELEKNLDTESTQKIENFLKINGEAEKKLDQAEILLPNTTTTQEGIAELKEISRNLDAMGVARKNWEIDFSVVRGLGYYTGPVFETILTDAPELGSVFSGGRYDNLLIPFTGQSMPAVGASLGVDRFMAILEKLNLLQTKATNLQVLILNLSPDLRLDYLSLADRLRQNNINTDIYLGKDEAMQAQLSYALKKEIPYIIIYGDDENRRNVVAIKNLRTREQTEVEKSKIVEYFKVK